MSTHRLCRVSKWTALGAGAVFAILFVFSLFLAVLWAPDMKPRGLQSVLVVKGTVIVTYGAYLDIPATEASSRVEPAAWQVFRSSRITSRWPWYPVLRNAAMMRTRQLIVPLWVPALLFSAVAAFLWRPGSRPGSTSPHS